MNHDRESRSPCLADLGRHHMTVQYDEHRTSSTVHVSTGVPVHGSPGVFLPVPVCPGSPRCLFTGTGTVTLTFGFSGGASYYKDGESSIFVGFPRPGRFLRPQLERAMPKRLDEARVHGERPPTARASSL